METSSGRGTDTPRDTLIYDIGAHSGEDTDFYLGKGFDVVAVEANPVLVSSLRERFSEPLRTGQLTIVDRAIGRGLDPSVQFFVNREKDDWSSLDLDVARKGNMAIDEVTVSTIELKDLFETYGVPYFLKVDIELGDLAVAESLVGLPVLPTYASFELHQTRILAFLAAAGYDSFQITNQFLNGFLQPVQPAREGNDYWPGPMGGYHSGLFGRELPEDDWLDLESALELHRANRLVSRHGALRPSWFDVHARRTQP